MPKEHDPDQWRAEGQCCWCRRQAYCKKACNAHRTTMQKRVERAVFARMFGGTQAAVTEIINGAEDYDA